MVEILSRSPCQPRCPFSVLQPGLDTQLLAGRIARGAERYVNEGIIVSFDVKSLYGEEAAKFFFQLNASRTNHKQQLVPISPSLSTTREMPHTLHVGKQYQYIRRYPEPMEISFSQTRIMVGLRIKERRQLKKWTLKDLAAASGTSSGYLSEVERGICTMSMEKLARVASALGAPCGELLGEPPPLLSGTVVKVCCNKGRVVLHFDDGQIVGLPFQ